MKKAIKIRVYITTLARILFLFFFNLNTSKGSRKLIKVILSVKYSKPHYIYNHPTTTVQSVSETSCM